MKISLVIPAYNEEKNIGATLTACLSFLKLHFRDFELIVVDDGSSDNTLDIIRRFKEVICISYEKNHGKGYAVKRGFLRASGDYIFFTDADLSYSLENIFKALTIFDKTKACGVIGIRNNKKCDYPPFRRFTSICFQKTVCLMLKTSISDTQCGFKAFDKQTARMLFSCSEIYSYGFDFEIIHMAQKMGKPLFPLPVSFCHRNNSHINIFSDSWKMLGELLKVRFKRSHYNANI